MTPREEGSQEFKEGWFEYDNPYDIDDPRWDEWMDGFYDAMEQWEVP